MKRIALAAAIALASLVPAQAQTTIHWLHSLNSPDEMELMNAAIAEYQTANPGVAIDMQTLDNESFKAKLPTLLQSDSAPDFFYSFGGGVLSEQVDAGVMRSVEAVVDPQVLDNIGTAGVSAYTRDGKLYGLAQRISKVGIWYNKNLFAEAGVDASTMGTWDGFLAGVQKLKDAGITPIALGAKDKWPAHFWWSYLVVRLAGQDAFEAAARGEGDGFAGAPFVLAGEKFLELVRLEPFQEGYEAMGPGETAKLMGDGKIAMELMGDWVYNYMKQVSESGTGIPDDQLGFMSFPQIEGGAGDPSDTLGGIEGWAFGKNASDDAVKFVEWFTAKENMSKFAAKGILTPIVAGAAEALSNPFQRQVSIDVNNAHWHAVFFDQALGPAVGGVVNDVSVELASDAISPEEAAALVKEAVDDNS